MVKNTKLVASLILSLMLMQFCGNLVLTRDFLGRKSQKPRKLTFILKVLVVIAQAFKKLVIGIVEIFVGIVGIIVGAVLSAKYFLDSNSTNSLLSASLSLVWKGAKNVVGAPVRLFYRSEEQKAKDQVIYANLGISNRRRNLAKSNFIKAGIVTATIIDGKVVGNDPEQIEPMTADVVKKLNAEELKSLEENHKKMKNQIKDWNTKIAALTKSGKTADIEGIKFLVDTAEKQIADEIEAQKRQRTLRIVYNVLRTTDIKIEKKFNEAKFKEFDAELKKAIEDKKSVNADVKKKGEEKFNEILKKMDPNNDPKAKAQFEEILTNEFSNYGVTKEDVEDKYFMIRMKIGIKALALVKRLKMMKAGQEVTDAASKVNTDQILNDSMKLMAALDNEPTFDQEGEAMTEEKAEKLIPAISIQVKN